MREPAYSLTLGIIHQSTIHQSTIHQSINHLSINHHSHIMSHTRRINKQLHRTIIGHFRDHITPKRLLLLPVLLRHLSITLMLINPTWSEDCAGETVCSDELKIVISIPTTSTMCSSSPYVNSNIDIERAICEGE